MKGQLSSELILSVVDPLQVEPRFKSIFFIGDKNPFTFLIKDGSGEFTVTMLNSEEDPIAEIVERGRKITVIPKKTGRVVLEVRDSKLPEAPPSTAVLEISGIMKLELHTNSNYIEKGQSVNMMATAYDNRLLPFDLDQYKSMDFIL